MMYQSIAKKKPVLLLIGLLYINLLFASNDPSPKGIFDVLGYQQLVNIQLTFDLEAVKADQRTETEYPAQLSFKDSDKRQQEWDIKIRGRGKFRRAKCNEMPPLKINFKKKDLEAAGLATFDDFKLVTYCVDDYSTAKELLLKEYLAYRIYNQITDLSFRVQLVNITYKDSNTGARKKQMGFLIEDTAQLRSRVGAEKSKYGRVVEADRFHPQYRKTVALFEYLIGNTDWEITFGKNIKHIVMDGMLIPVPYDFDFSALVGASYATFTPSVYGQTSLADRVYLGFEKTSPDLEATVAFFEEKRGAMYRTIQEFKLLSARERTAMIEYLDTFFDDGGILNFPIKDMATTASQTDE